MSSLAEKFVLARPKEISVTERRNVLQQSNVLNKMYAALKMAPYPPAPPAELPEPTPASESFRLGWPFWVGVVALGASYGVHRVWGKR